MSSPEFTLSGQPAGMSVRRLAPPFTSYTPPDPEKDDPAPDTGDARLVARIHELSRLVAEELEAPVVGARGEGITVRQAAELARQLHAQIQMDEIRGSRRHRSVSLAAKVGPAVFLGIIDLPIMLWLTAAVFNVDWARPLGLPLAVSIVITLLASVGSVATLYHLGHNLRESKNPRGGLIWRELTLGSRLSLLGVVALVLLIAALMMVRLYSEGVLSGVSEIALLLSLLVTLVMLVSASLVFHTAFRDGSPERDDLVHYRRLVEKHEKSRRSYADEAAELALRRNFLTLPAPPDETRKGP